MPDATPSDSLAAYLNDAANPVKLHAAKARIPDDVPTIHYADLVECDYDGYAPITLDDFAPVEDPEETVAEVLTSTVAFIAGDALAAPQQIHALYVVRHAASGPPQILELTPYDPPVNFVKPGNSLAKNIRVVQPMSLT